MLIESFESQFSCLIPKYDEIVCLKDKNINVLTNNDAPKLTEMLDVFGLFQHASVHTRVTQLDSTCKISYNNFKF